MKKEGKGILIIDDSQEIRETLELILGKHYKVIPARYAKEGLKNLSEDIGLVFLDYKLPDMTGLEALEHIKKLYPHIPVIFITGHGSEDVCRQAFKSGILDYIRKPFDADEIRYTVDSLMGSRREYSKPPVERCRPATEKAEVSEDKGSSDHILLNILKAKDYVDKNYTKPISLSDACNMACMSKTSFCKHFKKMIGKSFVDYINHMRVEKAKGLLGNESLSITDIASKLGYSSASYFIEMFKKITRCTPVEFRMKPR